jgi:hypothetical protein
VLDFWWHLKAGELIVTHGAIPRTDLFSFTAAGRTFVLQNWLAEVLYYVGYRIGDFPLLIALNAGLLVAALVPVYHLCYEACGRLRLSVLAASLFALTLALFGNMRPQVFSFVLLAAFYWVLSGYRDRRRDLLWALPPLMVLWVNLHGAFVLGLGLIALFLGCEAVRRLIHGPRSDTLSPGELRRLGLILTLTAFATLVNPETYKVYAYVRAVQADPGSQLFVTEWQAPRIDRLEGILIFYGPFFASLLVLLYARHRPSLTELALFLGFAIFALTARRNGVWFVLIVSPIVARYLPTLSGLDTLTSLRRFDFINGLVQRLERRKKDTAAPRYGLNALIAGSMLAITVILSPWVYPRLGIEQLGTALWEAKTPVGAMDYIQEHGLQGNIFHPQVYGDYLIWRLWPQQRSFFDGRVHLFGESLVRDYLLVFHDPHWEERLARYDIRYLLLEKDDDKSQRMIEDARTSPDWRLLYEDELSVLFERVR